MSPILIFQQQINVKENADRHLLYSDHTLQFWHDIIETITKWIASCFWKKTNKKKQLCETVPAETQMQFWSAAETGMMIRHWWSYRHDKTWKKTKQPSSHRMDAGTEDYLSSTARMINVECVLILSLISCHCLPADMEQGPMWVPPSGCTDSMHTIN